MVRYSLFLIAVLSMVMQASAQSVAVEPLHVIRSGGRSFPTPLVKPTDTVELRWSPATPGLRLKLGTRAGVYTLVDVPLGDGTTHRFSPEGLGLPVGVYHGVLTTSDKTILRDIQRDRNKVYSPELLFAVESPVAPTIIRPRGVITTPTPRFEWEAIPGVQSYVLAVSSTPFTIRTDPVTNEPVVEGMNLVWPLITTSTSAVYGEADPRSPFPQSPAPPLVPGREYNYTVLNAYSKTDPTFLSTVFGSVVSFVYEAQAGLPAPTLESPADRATFFGDRTIRFAWQPVEGATSYTFTLFERRSDGSSVGDFPMYSETTPAETIDLAASTMMRSGTYTWSVITNDASGAGGLSEYRSLTYRVPMGRFTFTTRSSVDQSGLIGVQVTAKSLDGGFSTLLPFVNLTSISYSDSLAVGRYSFEATKDGYADTTATVTIQANRPATVELRLRPLPSRISGFVRTPEGVGVENALVQLQSPEGVELGSAISGVEGFFEVSIGPGSYDLVASKEGYSSSAPVRVELDTGTYLELTEPLVVTATAGFVSGRVLSEAGQAVQLATVRARRDGITQEVSTDAAGQFLMTLAAGTWSIDVRKVGYVSPDPLQVTVARGEEVSGTTFVLTERAGRITGTVLGVRSANGGQGSATPISGAVVEAVPASGSVLRVVSDASGAFVLDLGAGAYEVRARAEGYTASTAWSFLLGLGQAVSGLTLELDPPNASVVGRVTDLAGRAVPGARVHDGDGNSTITDAGGGFTLDVSAGRLLLSAEADGYSMGDPVELGVPAGQTLSGITIRLAPYPALLGGRVTSAGLPVPRAVVRAVAGTRRVETRAGDDGRYLLRLPGGSWDVSAFTGLGDSRAAERVLLAPGASVGDLDLQVEREAAYLEGWITVSGRALPNATIRASRGPSSMVSRTRTDGSWGLAVRSGSAWTVEVSAPDAVPARRDTPTLASGQSVSFSFDLVPGSAIVSGTVRDESGNLLAGAQIDLVQDGTVVSSAVAQWDGTYRLSAPPGRYEAVASLAAYRTSRRELTLLVGENRRDTDFELAPEGATLIGRVGGIGNAPVAGAWVAVEGPGVLVSVRTETDGRFTASRLVPGTYVARASAPDGSSGETGGIQLAAGAAVEITIVVRSGPGVIRGVVRDESGAALPRALVEASHAALLARVLTSDDGSYALSGLAPGPWVVAVSASGYSPASTGVDITASPHVAEGVDLSLTPATARVEGLITVADSGLPMEGAQVRVESSAGLVTSRTDPDGRYVLRGVARGTVALTVTATGMVTQRRTIDLQGDAATENFALQPAAGRLSGRVVDRSGAPLPFATRVLVSDGASVRLLTTDASGAFVFERLEPGRRYELRTDISRIGYENARTEVDWPAGQTEFGPVDLVVSVSTAEIVGTVGTSGATIRIVRSTDGTVRSSVESRIDGTYRAILLPAGTWQVVPQKSGYLFSPSFRTVTTSNGERVTADFAAVSSVADLVVTIVDRLRRPVSGIEVLVTAADGSVVLTARTEADGAARFPSLPVGIEYVVRPSAPGASVSPASARVQVASPVRYTLEFTVSEASAFLSGKVLTEAALPVPESVVRVRHEAGSTGSASAGSDGRWTLGPLPAGAVAVWGVAPGYRTDTLRTVLLDGEQRSLPTLVLRPAGVRLEGRIVRAGVGVPGVRVEATARSTYSTLSDPQGFFSLPGLPLGTSATDTVTYVVRALPTGRPSVVRLARIAGDRIGGIFRMDDIVLPTGRIELLVDDGYAPLPAAGILLSSPDGRQLSGRTDVDGRFVTAEELEAGSYGVAVSVAGRPAPSGKLAVVDLASDSSKVARRLPMPFVHEPLSVVAVQAPNPVSVRFRREWDVSGVEAILSYRTASAAAATARTMVRRDTLFEASIDGPQGFEKVFYRVDLVDRVTGHAWSLPERALDPAAKGVLSQLRIGPTLAGAVVRIGERYAVEAIPRDALGNSLEDRFAGGANGGTLEWSVAGPATLLPSSDGSSVKRVLSVDGEGAITLLVTARLAGTTVRSEATATAETLEDLTLGLSIPTFRVDNQGTGIPLRVLATTSDGRPALLGESVSWRVEPMGAGSVDSRGFFVPSDPSFIGPVTATATDGRTGARASVSLALYARLPGGEAARLTDGRGMVLDLPAGAIPIPVELGLGDPVLAGPKRNARPVGDPDAWVAGDRLVRFTLRAGQGLAGDSLRQSAVLQLPDDPSMALHEGDRSLARFDASELRWTLLPTRSEGAGLAANVSRLTEFGTLVRTERLGLRHVAALPDPFSPDLGPLRIGYFLTTDAPPALVSIRILTVRGEPVRTLLSLDPQAPGRYGSRTGEREVLWDGLTDSGARARNGRYVIEIEATDGKGTVRSILPVVLVK